MAMYVWRYLQEILLRCKNCQPNDSHVWDEINIIDRVLRNLPSGRRGFEINTHRSYNSA